MGSTANTVSSTEPLLQRLADARLRTDELFSVVKLDAMYDRPIAERHRVIFYTGHLESFDWNLLGAGFFGLTSSSPSFDKLFAFGIDPVDGGLPSDQPADWPRREEIARYNARVRNSLDHSIATFDRSAAKFPARAAELTELLQVAIEHRLMHAETLAYMLHQLPIDRKYSPAQPAFPAPPSPESHMVEIPEGTATLGLRRSEHGLIAGESFGWDNEFHENAVEVPAFRVDAYPVTNRQFLGFLEQGGYQERSLWKEADWNWRSGDEVTHPAFWLQKGDQWFARTMFEEVPLPLDWPVSVSQAEASAYAKWAGRELPSEAEWHRAAYGTPSGAERLYPWGHQHPDLSRGNFDFERWDPTPVTAFPAGDSAFGVSDLAGNGWEWTRTVFAPFSGFEAFPFYAGYSANFFDGQHYVMKGGSARTAACMLRRSFRNWFQPHYPYVYSAFRCVEH